jgi:GTP cyclohydrolase IA
MGLLKFANGNIVRSEEEKQQMITEAAYHYGEFLTALGFDWKADKNSEDTPYRVAKAWINELVKGTNTDKPKITKFPAAEYSGMVFNGNIKVISMCSHHNLPFTGVAHVAYIPAHKDKSAVIGLSKLNRIVDWYARRPQLQEALTQQIHDEFAKTIENKGVAVYIQANHQCCSNRGIGHNSTMVTCVVSGYFFTNEIGTKDEFLKNIDNIKKQ